MARKPRPEPVKFAEKLGEIYLTYTESREDGEIRDPKDHWSSSEDDLVEFYATGLFTKPGKWQESILVPFLPQENIDKTIYVVVVRYYDGGTFGRTCGLWKVMGALRSKSEVKLLVDLIKDETNSREKQQIVAPFICGFYPCWLSYFAGLEGVEVHEFQLSGEEQSDIDPSSSVKWIKH
mgnify:CR=1 FL=1